MPDKSRIWSETGKLIAVFCICLIINMSVVSAASISHNPSSDVFVDGNRVQINWTTDEQMDSRVNYGNSTALGSQDAVPDLTTNHSVILENLIYGEVYYYELLSSNSSGNTIFDNNSGSYYTFTTGNAPVPTNDSLQPDPSSSSVDPTDTSPPEIQAIVPEVVNRMAFDFRGTTEPDTFIFLYVNPLPGEETGTGYTRFTTSDDSGNFSFRSVQLSQEHNTLALRAVDRGNNQYIAYYNVSVDATPPTITLSPDPLPGFVNSTTLQVTGTADEPVTINYVVNDVASTQESEGNFTFSLNLEHNKSNLVEISIYDKAGNGRDWRKTIYVDAEAPQILSHNLDQLSPSYIQEVTIRGQVSEPNATVIIFVNGQTSVSDAWTTSIMDNIKKLGKVITGDTDYITKTDRDGYFEVDVLLSINLEEEQTEPFYPDDLNLSFGGTTYYGGRTVRRTGSEYEPEYEWDNEIKIFVIDRVGLTAEDEGIITFAKCGHGSDWDIDISDASPGVVTPEHLRLGIAQFGFRVDLAWQGAGDEYGANLTEEPIVRTYELSQDRRNQYVVDPNELVGRGGIVSEWSEDRKTGYVVVPMNAYNYTQPDIKDIKMENLTLRIPMMIEIHYDYEWFGRSAQGTQKQCWDALLLLDVQVPPDTIPKWLLNSSIYLINSTITIIDYILKPLKKVALVVFVTCISSWLVLFFSMTQENLACFGLDRDDFGYCTEDAATQDPARCDECTQNIVTRRKVESMMHYVCDRMFCPSIPTVTRFLNTHKVRDCRKYSIIDFKSYTDSQHILADPEADRCITDYVDQWNAGCLFEDEFKLSKCMELGNVDDACGSHFKQFVNKASDFCSASEQTDDRFVNYKGQTFIRTRDDQGVPQWCLGEEIERGELEGGTGRIETREEMIQRSLNEDACGFGVHGGNNEVYQPREFNSGEVLDINDQGNAQILVGDRQVNYGNMNAGQINEQVSPYGTNAVIGESGQVYAYNPHSTEPRWEAIDPTDTTYHGSWDPFDEDYYDKYSGKTYGELSPSEQVSQRPERVRAPDEVEDEILTARHYIIKPASSILRAVQCVCIPAVTGYLTLWRNILEQVMLCFQSVLITGNPNTGLCRAVLTTYVCDLIFDAIRCFVERYSSVDAGTQPNTVGSFLKSVTSAGKGVHDSVINRYGDTSLFDAMFNERKVIHQLCLGAFTGDWDIDLEGMLTGAGAIPIKSEGFLYPHTRRFMTSNPLNGRTTYIYHIGVGLVAGSDLTYKIELVCSNDMSCDPSDNFLHGQCDCFRRGTPDVFPVTNFIGFGTAMVGSGRLEAGQMIGPNEGDIYIPAHDQAVRYDKVRLTWVYVNNERQTVTESIEKPIRLIGGKPPADCRFDIGSLEFRCKFEIGEKGYAAFTEWPEADRDFYYIGDKVNLKFQIEKKSPNYDPESELPEMRDPENLLPKWLCWDVTGQGGGTVNQPQCTEIRKDGVYTEKFFPQIPGITISQDNLVGGGTGAANCWTSGEWSSVITNLQCGSPASTITYRVSYDGTRFTYELGSYPSPGEWQSEGTATPCGLSGNTVTCGQFSFNLNEGQKPTSGSSTVIKASRSTTGGGLQCSDITEQAPRVWNVRLYLINAQAVDSERELSASNAIRNPADVVFYNNKRQEANIRIKVVCSDSPSQAGGKCSGFGDKASKDCMCYQDNDENNPNSIPCSADKYCYNYVGEQPECHTGQCLDPNTQMNTVCDCDTNFELRKNECLNKYCVNDAVANHPALWDADNSRENKGKPKLIDFDHCSEMPLDQLKQELGVTW
jgi:hypothetical protein